MNTNNGNGFGGNTNNNVFDCGSFYPSLQYPNQNHPTSIPNAAVPPNASDAAVSDISTLNLHSQMAPFTTPMSTSISSSYFGHPANTYPQACNFNDLSHYMGTNSQINSLYNPSFFPFNPQYNSNAYGSQTMSMPSTDRKRRRILFNTQQVAALEQVFKDKKYLNATERDDVARKIQLKPNQVKIWFQNMRYKVKLTDKEKNQKGKKNQRCSSTSASLSSNDASSPPTQSFPVIKNEDDNLPFKKEIITELKQDHNGVIGINHQAAIMSNHSYPNPYYNPLNISMPPFAMNQPSMASFNTNYNCL
uniref:Homeobox domain-containing protein n=1 Tax=Rhabditophanes sp. KR3021 TaxID=114890 RepID=A0AC35UBU7_9BILA